MGVLESLLDSNETIDIKDMVAKSFVYSRKHMALPVDLGGSSVINNGPDRLSGLFLSLNRLGIEVALAKEGVRITSIRHGTRFHKCGLKRTDVVTSVNDSDVLSLEVFHDLVRGAFAQELGVLRVRRDKKLLDIVLSFRQ